MTTETRDGSHLGPRLRHRDGRGQPPPAGRRTGCASWSATSTSTGPARRPAWSSRPIRSSGSTWSAPGAPVPAGFAALVVLGRGRRADRRRRLGRAWPPGRPGRCRPASATGRSTGAARVLAARPGRDWPADLVAGGQPDDRARRRPGRRVDLPQGAAADRRRRAGRRGPPAHAVAQPARRPHRDGPRARCSPRSTDLLAELAASWPTRPAPARCAAIGISGMAEAGRADRRRRTGSTLPVVGLVRPARRGGDRPARPAVPGRVPAPHRAAGQPAGHLRQAAARPRRTGCRWPAGSG